MSKHTHGRIESHDYCDGMIEFSLHFGDHCFGAYLVRTGEPPPPIMVMLAAAPDMLEALEVASRTIAALHGPIGWDLYRQSPEMRKIDSAIAKARGETK